MAIGDLRYADVNALHAQGYPPCSRVEAEKALKILYREFGKLQDACAIRERPLRHDDSVRQFVRRCWISLKPTKGTHRGWGRLIHDVGHRVYRYRHPNYRPHGPGEEKIELAIAQFVRERFLDGSLKDKPKVKPDRLVVLEERLEKWQRKLARAENAIRKLNRKIAYHRKKV